MGLVDTQVDCSPSQSWLSVLSSSPGEHPERGSRREGVEREGGGREGGGREGGRNEGGVGREEGGRREERARKAEQ